MVDIDQRQRNWDTPFPFAPSVPSNTMQSDLMNYGKASWDAQKWNRPSFQEPGNTDRGPWLHSDVDMINPNVAEEQYGLNAYPGAASNWAKIYNQGWNDFRFDSPKDIRDTLNWARTRDLLYSTKPIGEEYGMYDTLGLAGEDDYTIMDDLARQSEVASGDFIDQAFRSKEEDVYDNIYTDIGNAANMLQYGRQNPFLIEDEGGWTARDPMEISYGYEQNLGDQYRYSSDRQPEINNPFIPSDRQPGINNPFMPSDRQPGIDEFNNPLKDLPSDRQPGIDEFNDKLRMGLTYPEGIGLDRAPEEILSVPPQSDRDDPNMLEKILPFFPAIGAGKIGKAIGQGLGDLFSQDDIYQDPIMNMADVDQSAYSNYEMANLSQTWQKILDQTGSEDLANEWVESQQTANIENFDYYHYRRNGYTHEETMQILEEQGLA